MDNVGLTYVTCPPPSYLRAAVANAITVLVLGLFLAFRRGHPDVPGGALAKSRHKKLHEAAHFHGEMPAGWIQGVNRDFRDSVLRQYRNEPPRDDIGTGDEGRQDSDPSTGNCRGTKGIAIVGLKRCLELD